MHAHLLYNNNCTKCIFFSMQTDNVIASTSANASASTSKANASEENSDDDANWQQVVTGKRRHTGSPNIFQPKRPHNLNEENSSSNKYAALATEEGEIESDNVVSETFTPKPPPIFVPDVGNIDKMVEDIAGVIARETFYFKCMKDSQIRLTIKDIDSYRKLVKHLETSKKNFHTYQPKNDRAFRVVFKGLHHTTPVEDIKAKLLTLGHQVRSVRGGVSRVNKQPLSILFVDLDPKPNNKEVYNITSIENARLTVEAPRTFDDIVQCIRCQEYGHTKSYCRKPYRCVKCGLSHPTSQCTKKWETPPQCVNCLEKHTASYKGCKVYQKLISGRSNNSNNSSNNNPRFYTNQNNNNFVNTADIQPPDDSKPSYSQAARGMTVGVNNILQKLESMVAKQIELTNTLINMMSMLMTKICN